MSQALLGTDKVLLLAEHTVSEKTDKEARQING